MDWTSIKHLIETRFAGVPLLADASQALSSAANSSAGSALLLVLLLMVFFFSIKAALRLFFGAVKLAFLVVLLLILVSQFRAEDRTTPTEGSYMGAAVQEARDLSAGLRDRLPAIQIHVEIKPGTPHNPPTDAAPLTTSAHRL